jgi:sulfite dehydrogenase
MRSPVADRAFGGPPCLPLVAAALLAAAPAPAQEGGGADLGRQVFLELAEPACAICHTLAAAGAAGTIAPSLDELKPSKEAVLAAVAEGIGVMPSYAEKLSEEEIEAVAEYVAEVAGAP